VQHNLGVTVRCEATAALDELSAEFGVVIDFAVEDEDDVAILADHRLLPSSEVDDLQTDRTERNVVRLVHSLLIRTTMDQFMDGIANTGWIEDTIPMRKTGNSTHRADSPLLANMAGIQAKQTFTLDFVSWFRPKKSAQTQFVCFLLFAGLNAYILLRKAA
jgi:hypothetical protein